jgi:hypothetical protein
MGGAAIYRWIKSFRNQNALASGIQQLETECWKQDDR